MPAQSIDGIPMAEITGPLILGLLGSFVLYGILIVQFNAYLSRFPSDQLTVKILVWSIFFLSTLFTICSTDIAFRLFGSGWGDTDVLAWLNWAWVGTEVISGLIALLVQSFYVWRIWKLSNIVWLPLFVEAIGILACGSTIYIAVKAVLLGSLTKLESDPHAIVVISMWLSTSAVCDILITVVILFLLCRAKSRSSSLHSGTNKIIAKLIQYTIETGMLTSIVAFVNLALYLTRRGSEDYYWACFFVMGRCYACGLFATLNYRYDRGHRLSLAQDRDTRVGQQSINVVFWSGTGLWDEPEPRTSQIAVEFHIDRQVVDNDSNTLELNTVRSAQPGSKSVSEHSLVDPRGPVSFNKPLPETV